MDMAEGINNGKECKLINGSFVNVRKKDGMRFGPSLNDVMKIGLLPTPTTRDYKGARSTESLKQSKRL